MSVMTRFQKKKKENPEYGENQEQSFKVLGAMPSSGIRKQQVARNIEKELEDDLAKLKLIKSIKQKEAEKESHLVPKYLPFVKKLMESGQKHPLIGFILVWMFDTKDIHGAMELAAYCIEKEIPMPEHFKRDLPAYLCDTVLEWAEKEHEDERSVEPYFGQICEMSKNWDIPDQVSAKIFRLRGIIALDKEDFDTAVFEFTKAEEYGAKVKTLLSKAKKAAEK